MRTARQDLRLRRQRELEPVDPEVPEEPDEPEVPGEPEDFDEPLPDMPDDEVPLAPELWSLARRSQPANAMERAATTNRICEVLTSGFIVVPFIKMDNVSFLTVKVARSSSLFCKHLHAAIAVSRAQPCVLTCKSDENAGAAAVLLRINPDCRHDTQLHLAQGKAQSDRRESSGWCMVNA